MRSVTQPSSMASKAVSASPATSPTQGDSPCAVHSQAEV
jgi:hypothetical protein